MGTEPTLRERAIAEGKIRPESVTIPQWLAQGSTRERGVITRVVPVSSYGYVLSRRFPSLKFYFRFSSFPFWQDKKEIVVGKIIKFDVPSQEYVEDAHPVAVNCAIAMETPKEE